MKKKIFHFVATCVSVLALSAACTDLSQIENQISEINAQIASLKELCDDVNDDITALKAFNDRNKVITSYTKDGKIYTLNLSDGSSIKLREGIEGESLVPVIAIDGQGYWTVDGVRLTMGGDPVPAKGERPVFGVDSEGYWTVTYSDGTEYVKDSQGNKVKAAAENNAEAGESFFSDVKVETDKIVVTLTSDGQSYSLPIVPDFLFSISGVEFQPIIFAPGQSQTFAVQQRNVTAAIFTNIPQGWTAVLEEEALTIVAPTAGTKASADSRQDISILAFSNNGFTTSCTVRVQSSDNPVLALPVDLTGANGETSNSYIVSAPGAYKLKTVKGNGTESVGTVATAEVLWETFNSATAPAAGDLISIEGTPSDGYITFKTANSFKEGNALIAAKDAAGTILWSWHIWLTDTPADQTYNNGAKLMDRNLGAISATPGDFGALGLFYQWGRKDPFLGACKISGSNSKAHSTHSTEVNLWESINRVESVEDAIKQPTKIIQYTEGDNSWMTSQLPTTLWGDEKTIYDPCPIGYKVPKGGSNGGVWSSAAEGTNYSGAYDATKYGFELAYKDTETAYFSSVASCWYPLAGYLTTKTTHFAFSDWPGNVGGYWSCTRYANEGTKSNAHCFTMKKDGTTSVNNNERCGRALSVRCQKIE